MRIPLLAAALTLALAASASAGHGAARALADEEDASLDDLGDEPTVEIPVYVE